MTELGIIDIASKQWGKEEREAFLAQMEEKTKEVEREIEEWRTPKSQESTDRESKSQKHSLKEENRKLRQQLISLRQKKKREDERSSKIISQKTRRIQHLENTLKKYSGRDLMKLSKKRECIEKEIEFLKVKKHHEKTQNWKTKVKKLENTYKCSIQKLEEDLSALRKDYVKSKEIWENQVEKFQELLDNLS